MLSIPFAIRIRGTITSLREEMAATYNTDEYVDWSNLIETLETTLEEMPEEELNEVMEVPDFVDYSEDTELEIW